MKTSVLSFGAAAVLVLAGGASAAPVASALWTAGAEAAEDRYERAVRRAFDDEFRRDPSDRELRYYSRKMEDERWSESDLRREIRREVREDRRDDRRDRRDDRRDSREVERVVRRAYQDVLDREPDSAGLRLYRSRMIDDDWSEQDVREALRKSPEYREKSRMTRPRAEEIVRRAYRSVLNRDPDSGSRGYIDKVLYEKWTEADVERELRKSPEYRRR
ncbi:MAG: hypothetical protein ABW221_09840 [Vicinamibacteria bacterium]